MNTPRALLLAASLLVASLSAASRSGKSRRLLVRAEDLYPAQLGLGNIIAVTDGGRTLLSQADFAMALIDEAEQARHLRQQFSVAY